MQPLEPLVKKLGHCFVAVTNIWTWQNSLDCLFIEEIFQNQTKLIYMITFSVAWTLIQRLLSFLCVYTFLSVCLLHISKQGNFLEFRLLN